MSKVIVKVKMEYYYIDICKVKQFAVQIEMTNLKLL